MTQEEMRLKREQSLSQKISQKYKSVIIDERICFLLGNGSVCRLDSLGGEYNALVIEYADNIDMANKGIFGEDGDLFYMDEMSEDEMLDAMMKEIDSEM